MRRIARDLYSRFIPKRIRDDLKERAETLGIIGRMLKKSFVVAYLFKFGTKEQVIAEGEKMTAIMEKLLSSNVLSLEIKLKIADACQQMRAACEEYRQCEFVSNALKKDNPDSN